MNVENQEGCRRYPILTSVSDWPEGSPEWAYAQQGHLVYITGPQIDADGSGRLIHPVRIDTGGSKSGPPVLVRPIPSVATIYFIGPEGGPIKIGWASSAARRLKDLSLANAYSLHLWASVEGAPAFEKEYHRRFAAYRLHGEWFTRCPEIEAEIARLNSTPDSRRAGGVA